MPHNVRQEYVYSPLETGRWIRTIHLLPSPSFDAPLQCSVRELDIDEDQDSQFEAISYTWGEAKFDYTLYVTTQESQNTHFRITQSLCDALRSFRLKHRSRILWADAVCINQRDPHEKSSQIPLMEDIYKHADNVLVWLGTDPSVGTAMETINWISKSLGANIEASTRLRLIGAIDILIQQPWFSRRWIIQEVVRNHAVSLHCTSNSLQWLRLMTSIRMLGEETGTSNQQAMDALCQMQRLWRRLVLLEDSGPGHTLLENFHAFSHFGCANPRDRIFALAALSSDVSMTREPRYPKRNFRADPVGSICWAKPQPQERLFRIVPDYNKKWRKVYISFAAEVIRNGLLSWLLCRTWHGQKVKGLPAWAPDWRISAPEKPFFLKEILKGYSGSEAWASHGLPMMADWPKTRLHGQILRLSDFSILLKSKMPKTTIRGPPEDTAHVRAIWKSQALTFTSSSDPLSWLQSFIDEVSKSVKATVKCSFEVQDLNDAMFCLLIYLLGRDPWSSNNRWCSDNAPLAEKVLSRGLPTDGQSFSALNGGRFIICAQGPACDQSLFFGYAPVDFSMENDILVRPENSLQLGISGKERVVRIALVLRERNNQQTSVQWTNNPLGWNSNSFKLRGQALMVDIQRDSYPRSNWTETMINKYEYDFDLA
ncbi:hypothetical protein CGMCC3_g442 [Colletotrichum fructicola]|uniref:Heterokaryon incompatibility protein 6, OR allele n=1 Tax=Colletotrichum fructicola (strain Nara gc5) TaxID=1213859 RepID=L2FFC6_COLFN|nr:uncharacterized protein CGMCC3_g442 [Colletotrichum fructicola]KAE9583966.1 hypothetical protein CGMCC3_g442 [Colletotrichum fructicola]KAF4486433.1 Heterokaryon incompatibility protein 6, OR allele [Colletotrichum fructicola Nara gc5]